MKPSFNLPWFVALEKGGVVVPATERATITWRQGVCTISRGQERRRFDVGTGWLVVNAGSCSVVEVVHNAVGFPNLSGISCPENSIVFPSALPLGSEYWRYWQQLDVTFNVAAGLQDCILTFIRVSGPNDGEDIRSAMEDDELKSGFDDLRQRFLLRGFDPYLSFLQDKGSYHKAFEHVPQSANTGVSLERILFQEAEDKFDDWKVLADFDFPTDSLVLVLDGWVRTSVNIGDASQPVSRIVDLQRGPALLGLSHRPRSREQGPMRNCSLKLEVKPMEKRRRAVHVLKIPYSVLEQWYANPSLDARLTLDETMKYLELQRWLIMSARQCWRVFEWLIQEHKRKGDSAIWIPKNMLAFKLMPGTKSEPTKESAGGLTRDVLGVFRCLQHLGIVRSLVSLEASKQKGIDCFKVQVLRPDDLRASLVAASTFDKFAKIKKKEISSLFPHISYSVTTTLEPRGDE